MPPKPLCRLVLDNRDYDRPRIVKPQSPAGRR